jgi:hypothetical protein
MAIKININPALFWDIEFDDLDCEKNARQIIERVLTRGSLSDWFEIKSFYGKDRLKTEIVKIRFLDKVTFNFCSKYFQIPKNQFKCYNIPQSYQQLWNY